MVSVIGAVATVHLLFAGLWAGSVFFVTAGVLPTAHAGDIAPGPLEHVANRLVWTSRLSALALLLTGGHMAATLYTGPSLLGSITGNLVVVMVVGWATLAGLVEVGASRLRDGTGVDKVRTPAAEARPFFLAATAVGAVVLAIGGYLAYV